MTEKRRNLPLRGKGERKRRLSRAVGHAASAAPRAEAPRKAGMTWKKIAALYRLMAWLSPSFPVGAFSYSSGIEWAVEAGDITRCCDADRLAVADDERRRRLLRCRAVRARASRGGRRRRDRAARDRRTRRGFLALEGTASGNHRAGPRLRDGDARGLALRRAAICCDPAWDGPVAYPVAVATACAGHGIAAKSALPAFLHAVAANWISAGVRLIPLGQTDGQRVLAAMEAVIAATAARALHPRSTTSAARRCAPISRRCGMKPNIRGCSDHDEKP